jgi:ergothioneine biosynthesis protein EgtB
VETKTREDTRSDLLRRFAATRGTTRALIQGLSAEDCAVQSMTLASPIKWHLAHTSWFFETFILERAVQDSRPFDPSFRVLFNSYYNTVGEQYSRPDRGLLTRPGLERVLEYRDHVDRGIRACLERTEPTSSLDRLVEIGIQHEQQHQELIVTDLKHLLSINPLHPVYRELPEGPASSSAGSDWIAYDEGIHRIGHDGEGFCFDNELPRHRVFLEAFELASRPVTNAEYLEFIEAGGYRTPELWLSDGWDAVREQAWEAPAYWIGSHGRRRAFTLGGLRDLRPDEPVCHVSYYEADAFARWKGARLPTEAEWEVAAADAEADGNFVEDGHFHPVPTPAGPAKGPSQMMGNLWEWTQSPYVPYPGYRAPAGALGEYNGKFMCNQLVLRGGSCATPRSHIRATYRNFFYPDARWQFSGIRLARDRA